MSVFCCRPTRSLLEWREIYIRTRPSTSHLPGDHRSSPLRFVGSRVGITMNSKLVLLGLVLFEQLRVFDEEVGSGVLMKIR